MQLFSRYTAVLPFVIFLAGCAADKPAPPPPLETGLIDECKLDRKACLYEGRYESKEQDFARDEAKRLNGTQKIRLVKSEKVAQPAFVDVPPVVIKEEKIVAVQKTSKKGSKKLSRKKSAKTLARASHQ